MTDKLLPCKHCQRPTAIDSFGLYNGRRVHIDGCIITLHCRSTERGHRNEQLETVAEIDE